MNGEDFLSVAAQLVRNGDEAAWRSAISRSYYAAWHVARVLLAEQGAAIPANYQSHAAVRDWLLNSKSPELSHLGSYLGDLHRMRLRADYRIDDLIIRQQEAQIELLKARAFIRELKEAFT